MPKFNTPKTKQRLAKFATEIAPECGISEINFGENGITYQRLAKFATEIAPECGISEINFVENGITYHGRGLPLNVKSKDQKSIFNVKSQN